SFRKRLGSSSQLSFSLENDGNFEICGSDLGVPRELVDNTANPDLFSLSSGSSRTTPDSTLITGKVNLTLQRPLSNAVELRVHFAGRAQVDVRAAQWMEDSVGGQSGGPSVSSRKIVNQSVTVWRASDTDRVLPPGTHVWPFSISVPSDLPPSVSARHGMIEYNMKAVLHRKGFSPDIVTRRPVTIAHTAPRGLPFHDIVLRDPAGNVEVTVTMPMEVFAEDQNVKVSLRIKVLRPDIIGNVQSVRCYVQEQTSYSIKGQKFREQTPLGNPVRIKIDDIDDYGSSYPSSFGSSFPSSWGSFSSSAPPFSPPSFHDMMPLDHQRPRIVESVNIPTVRTLIPLHKAQVDVDTVEMRVRHKLKIRIESILPRNHSREHQNDNSLSSSAGSPSVAEMFIEGGATSAAASHAVAGWEESCFDIPVKVLRASKHSFSEWRDMKRIVHGLSGGEGSWQLDGDVYTLM
ncbi:Arrestin domain-containing protein 3, partial [Quaeritorhiza haematococci]